MASTVLQVLGPKFGGLWLKGDPQTRRNSCQDQSRQLFCQAIAAAEESPVQHASLVFVIPRTVAF